MGGAIGVSEGADLSLGGGGREPGGVVLPTRIARSPAPGGPRRLDTRDRHATLPPMLPFLLACAEMPSVTFPVTIPSAENGAAMLASEYVRPAVTTLDDTALCGEPDVRGYLADGSFGWRVLEMRADGLVGPGGEPLRDLAPRWRAADARVSEVCGTHERGAALIVADQGAAFEGAALTAITRLLPDTDLHILVSDTTPGALVPARVGTGDQWTLAVTDKSWALLSFTGVGAFVSFNRADAISSLAQLNPGLVVLTVDAPTWGKVTAELDALAPHGIRPILGLAVGTKPAPPPTPAAGSTHIVLADTLAVVPLDVDSSRIQLIQLIGPSGADKPLEAKGAP